MGILQAIDTIVHGGVQQPETYEKKKAYQFGPVLGKRERALSSTVPTPNQQSFSFLGCGAFGFVKRATRIKDGKEVAIKVIPKRNLKGRFDLVYAEMRVLSGLNHPNVIGFYDWFESR